MKRPYPDPSSQLRAAVDDGRRNGSGLVLVLVLPEDGPLFRAQAELLDLPYVDVSLSLSRRLLDVPVADRAWQASRALPSLIPADATAVAAGHLGLLFLPELQLDPLRALLQLARSRLVVAEWMGTFEHGVLSYARPGHAEAAEWPHPACAVVPLRG